LYFLKCQEVFSSFEKKDYGGNTLYPERAFDRTLFTAQAPVPSSGATPEE